MADPDVESWENVSKGKIGINKFGDHGMHSVIQEVVGPGRKVLVSKKEREVLNSERTYSIEVDPFKNGNLRPITLASDSGDIEENPNHMSESDLVDLFGVRNWLQFRSALKEISSSQILERLLVLATDDDDDDEINATVKQFEVIRDRLAAVTGQSDVIEVQQAGSVAGMSEGDDRKTIVSMRRE